MSKVTTYAQSKELVRRAGRLLRDRGRAYPASLIVKTNYYSVVYALPDTLVICEVVNGVHRKIYHRSEPDDGENAFAWLNPEQVARVLVSMRRDMLLDDIALI